MRLSIYEPVMSGAVITARYRYGATTYAHQFTLPSEVNPGDDAVRRLARWLAVIHSCYLFTIEYFTDIVTDFPLSDEERRFFEKTIYNGMAEFRYVNSLPIDLTTTVRGTGNPQPPAQTFGSPSGRLLLNGGGKDGLVSAMLLRDSNLDYELFQIGTGVAQAKAATAIGKTAFVFRREMDEHRTSGQYKGHCPTSAAIAIAAALTAYTNGKRDVIASNESSANEPTLELDGVVVNHQYSKSVEFEHDINDLLVTCRVPVRYFSLLRPLHELQIITLLATYPDIWTQFISCNHGFRRGYWCMACAKCAFISLVTTAISPALASTVFSTDDALQTPALFDHVASLVDPHITKPLECVGTLIECQVAAKRIAANSEITLSPEMRTLLERTSQHVTDDHADAVLHRLDEHHLIPATDYSLVVELITTKLTRA